MNDVGILHQTSYSHLTFGKLEFKDVLSVIDWDEMDSLQNYVEHYISNEINKSRKFPN